jgi:predicted amidohydrolase
MKIALVQMECRWGEIARNIAAMEAFVSKARKNGADIVVFPELSVTGIYKDDRVWDLAEDIGGPSVARMCDIARSHGAIVGFGFTERANPLPYNAYALANADGTLVGIYRKNHIPRLEVPWWQGHFARPVFPVAGKRFAVAICWDTTQPELLAEYGRKGAQIVLMPHAWDADPLGLDGKDLEHNTMQELYDHYAKGRLGGWRSHDGMLEQFLRYIPAQARKNRFYALFVNQAGQPHPVLHMAGPTFAVTPEGELMVCTSNGKEQTLYVDIP